VAAELGWEKEDGPFNIQYVPGAKVLMSDEFGVIGLKYEGKWYSTKSYFAGVGPVRPWVHDNWSNSMPSFEVSGHTAGLVEVPFPIVAENGSKLADCVMALRMLYLDNAHEKRLDIVNVCLVSTLTTGETVVHDSSWDIFEGGGFYDIKALRDYFKPRTERSLGQASYEMNGVTAEFAKDYQSMAAYFKPSIEGLLENGKFSKNQYYAFILSMEAAKAEKGKIMGMLEDGEFPMNKVLVPISIYGPIKWGN
jgi:hypothetical protein